MPADAAWLMLVGDLTAMPAMARIAEHGRPADPRSGPRCPTTWPATSPGPDADVTWLDGPRRAAGWPTVVESHRLAGRRRLLLDGRRVRADARDPQAPDARAAAARDGVRRDGLLARLGRPAAARRRPGPDLARGQGRRACPTRRSGPHYDEATDSMTRQPFRSGFASFVGRPNAGKSTLTNALVGTKVVITSDKPQTTRTVVRGIVHRAGRPADPGRHPRPAPAAHPARRAAQRPGADDLGRGRRGRGVLPGQREDRPRRPVHRHRDGQGPAHHEGRGRHQDRPRHARADRRAPARHPAARAPRPAPSGPRSCRSRRSRGDQVQLLADLLVGLLPEGPQLYPDGDLTDAPEEILVAELIREAALEGVRDELPHSIAVVVEEMGLREDRPADRPLLDIHANLYVERDSQKGIVIGHKGARLREVGTRARTQIEALLGTPVYLDLHVKIAKDWQRDPRQLGSWGSDGRPMPAPSRLARHRRVRRPGRPRRPARRRRGLPLAGGAHARRRARS